MRRGWWGRVATILQLLQREKGVRSVFLSVRKRGEKRHSVKSWSRAIFNLLWQQPDRASLYIARERQLG